MPKRQEVTYNYMDEKQFDALDKEILNEIPVMTDNQLVKVEIWGEYSKIEQDKRFPANWESQKRKKQ